jgi:hypothetical protein
MHASLGETTESPGRARRGTDVPEPGGGADLSRHEERGDAQSTADRGPDGVHLCRKREQKAVSVCGWHEAKGLVGVSQMGAPFSGTIYLGFSDPPAYPDAKDHVHTRTNALRATYLGANPNLAPSLGRHRVVRRARMAAQGDVCPLRKMGRW